MRIGREGSTDKLILRSGKRAPYGLRYYLSIRLPFTRTRVRSYRLRGWQFRHLMPWRKGEYER